MDAPNLANAQAKDYIKKVLAEFEGKQKATRERQLKWWAARSAGLSLAEINGGSNLASARCPRYRDLCTWQAAHQQETGVITPPKEYTRTGAR
jgi:hypothetical protein